MDGLYVRSCTLYAVTVALRLRDQEGHMRKRRSRHAESSPPQPIVSTRASSPFSFIIYPGAHSWPQNRDGYSCSAALGGLHPILKLCLVLFCGMTLLSGCAGAVRQRPDDASLRYLADAEETMPIPYTPRDDGQPLTAVELQAFKTVSDLDRHLIEEEARIVELHFKNYLHQMRGSFDVYLRRSARFLPYVKQVFASRGIPDDIAYLFMVESGGNPVAVSHAGAAGLWQFMPATGKIYGLQQDNWIDERRDPYKATVAAADYLQKLYREFCNWHLAVAAYNAGEGKIGRAISGTGASDFFDLCRLDVQLEARARLKDETRDYVPRLIAMAKIMRNLDRLGLMKPTNAMAWKLAPMNVPPLTDLNTLAMQLGMDWSAFSAMNPAYLRPASPPQQTIAYVPSEKLSTAVRWAASREARVYDDWQEYATRKGDSLPTLAKRHQVSEETIKQVNNLVTAQPKQGKVFSIPGQKPEGAFMASSSTAQPDVNAPAAAPGASLPRAFPFDRTDGVTVTARPSGITPSRSFSDSPVEKHMVAAKSPDSASSAGFDRTDQPVAVASVASVASGAPGAQNAALPVPVAPVGANRELRQRQSMPLDAPAGLGGEREQRQIVPFAVANKRLEATVGSVASVAPVTSGAPGAQNAALPVPVVPAKENQELQQRQPAPLAAPAGMDREREQRQTAPLAVVETRPAAPVVSATPAAPVASATPAAPEKQTESRKPVTRYYVVQQGDTMYGLARQWGTDIAAIQAANKMDTTRTTVKVGEKLAMPAGSEDGATSVVAEKVGEPGKDRSPKVATVEAEREAPAKTASGPKTFNALTGGVDVAGSGGGGGKPIRADYVDTGGGTYFSEKELLLGAYASPSGGRPIAASPQAPDDEAPKVFLNVYAKRGERLEDIAQANGVSVRALREANGFDQSDQIWTGQRILVPKN